MNVFSFMNNPGWQELQPWLTTLPREHHPE